MNECSVLSPSLPLESTRVRGTVRPDERTRFIVGILLSPFWLDALPAQATTATVSMTTARVLTAVSSSSFELSVGLYDARSIEKNATAEDLASFFPGGWTSDRTVITRLIGVESVLETDSIVSAQKSVFGEIRGDSVLGTETRRVPVLSVVGQTLGLTTDPVLKDSIASFSQDQDKELWISQSKYIVAGILVLQGIALDPLLFEVQLGMSLEWDSSKQDISVAQDTEQISTQDVGQRYAVVPITSATQSQTLQEITSFEDKEFPMYQCVSQEITFTITNNSNETRTIEYWTVAPSLDSDSEAQRSRERTQSVVEGDQVFPNGEIPRQTVFFAEKTWLDQSIYAIPVPDSLESPSHSQKGLVLQHNLVAMESMQTINISMVSLAKKTEVLSQGFKVTRAADNAVREAIYEMMRLGIQTSNSPVGKETESESWGTTIGETLVVHEMLDRMRDFSITCSYQNAIEKIPLLTGLPEIGACVVFEQELSYTFGAINYIYCIPSLAMQRSALPSFSQETRWKVEQMILHITQISGKINYVTTASCRNETFTQEGLFSQDEIAPGIWHTLPSNWRWENSFYGKNGFVFENTGFLENMSISPEKSLVLPLLSTADQLFVLKTEGSQKTFSISKTSQDAQFTLPQNPKMGVLEQISSLVIRIVQETSTLNERQKFKFKLSVAATRIE